MLTAAAKALAAGLQLVLSWFTAKNSPEEVARKEAADQQAVKDRITQDVAKGDAKSIERDIS